jgi:hypothetical protein
LWKQGSSLKRVNSETIETLLMVTMPGLVLAI